MLAYCTGTSPYLQATDNVEADEATEASKGSSMTAEVGGHKRKREGGAESKPESKGQGGAQPGQGSGKQVRCQTSVRPYVPQSSNMTG
jgi:hypothetical protein